MDPQISYYQYSKNYSNDNGKENTSTKEVVSEDGKIAKVYETNNGKSSTYWTDDIFKPSSLPFLPEFHFSPLTLEYLPFSKNKKNTTPILYGIIIVLLCYIFYLRYRESIRS